MSWAFFKFASKSAYPLSILRNCLFASSYEAPLSTEPQSLDDAFEREPASATSGESATTSLMAFWSVSEAPDNALADSATSFGLVQSSAGDVHATAPAAWNYRLVQATILVIMLLQADLEMTRPM